MHSLLSINPAEPAALSLVGLVFGLATIAGMWMVFSKADEPGWAAVIPIYNLYTLVKVSDNEWWWLLGFFIPLVNILTLAKISLDIAGEFDQGIGFAAGLALLPFLFYPLLGFGGYRYDTGPPSIRG
ncbi:signal peptidase I [Halobacteriales archaeon QH_10_67_13]|nr:MAG: signal peptidase I [Halobacteriales archaeon QH_10_67_13]